MRFSNESILHQLENDFQHGRLNVFQTYERDSRVIIQLLQNDVQDFIDGKKTLSHYERQIHGSILSLDGKLLCPSMPLAEEVSDEEILKLGCVGLTTAVMDGSLIRLYHDQGNWQVSTSKMINAFKANCFTKEQWYGEDDPLDNYGSAFVDVMCQTKFNINELEKDKAYYYIIRHPSWYMTLPSDNSTSMQLIATFDRVSFEFDFIKTKPTKWNRGTNLVIQQGPNIIRYKNDNSKFKSSKELQGNCINPLARYLSLAGCISGKDKFFRMYIKDKTLVDRLDRFVKGLILLSRSETQLNTRKIYQKLQVTYVPFHPLYSLMNDILDHDFFSPTNDICIKYSNRIVDIFNKCDCVPRACDRDC